MAWGGNHLELTKEEYIKQIQDMTGKINTRWLTKLNKKELKHIKAMIEEARNKAIDEYKKNLNLMM